MDSVTHRKSATDKSSTMIVFNTAAILLVAPDLMFSAVRAKAAVAGIPLKIPVTRLARASPNTSRR